MKGGERQATYLTLLACSRRLASLVVYIDDATEANGALQLLPVKERPRDLPSDPHKTFTLLSIPNDS